MSDLTITLGRLRLANPILVASGTFGYAREMAGVVDFAKLGGVIPKTVTRQPRAGNSPPRTIETPSGMLNAIGLDNDGIDHFIHHHLPYLRTLPTAVIANIAGHDEDEFVEMAIDWRRRRPILGNITGGLSGPAIKPLALRLVWRVARHVTIPVIGVGGIATIDDVMEFLVAGASAVQVGTANFYDPTVSCRLAEQLPAALAELGAGSVREVIGTLRDR